MPKTIVIQEPSWLERHPVQIRRLLVRLVFSLGAQHGWEIRMDKQRWRDDSPTSVRPTHVTHEAITDEQWAMLMGHTPS